VVTPLPAGFTRNGARGTGFRKLDLPNASSHQDEAAMDLKDGRLKVSLVEWRI
jgi:hypothetical protein